MANLHLRDSTATAICGRPSSRPTLPSNAPSGSLDVAPGVHIIIAPPGSGKRRLFATLSNPPFANHVRIVFLSPSAVKARAHAFIQAHCVTTPPPRTIILLRTYADFAACHFNWIPASVSYISPRNLPDSGAEFPHLAATLIPYLNEIADVATVRPSALRLRPSLVSAAAHVVSPSVIVQLVFSLLYLVASFARGLMRPQP